MLLKFPDRNSLLKKCSQCAANLTSASLCFVNENTGDKAVVSFPPLGESHSCSLTVILPSKITAMFFSILSIFTNYTPSTICRSNLLILSKCHSSFFLCCASHSASGPSNITFCLAHRTYRVLSFLNVTQEMSIVFKATAVI